MTGTYDVGGVLPDDGIQSLPAGTNLLITGPAMVGKRDLAFRLLAAGHESGEGILLVTTSESAASLIDELERRIPTIDRDLVAIVDCSGAEDQQAIEELAMERVSSPGDLTGISIGTAKLLQQFSTDNIDAIRHGLVSISTLIQYLDLNTVFKFLHIYTSRIEDTNGLGIFTMDSQAHDSQTTSTITAEFDAVIELRENNDGSRDVRIRGLPDTDRTWRPYP